jgi:hypothetical protein
MPVPPDCGEFVAMVWDDPGTQFSTSGADVGVLPSAETRRPEGLVVIVTATVAGEMFTHHPPPMDAAPLPVWSMAYNAHVPLGAVFWNVEVSVAVPSVAA